MELRHLRYFLAVAEHLNFRRAAEALNTAQPSLSLQIRALEDELRVQLFERNRRKVELTPAGRFYVHEVRRILSALQLANEQVAGIAAESRDEIVIGSARGTIVRYLPDLMNAMRAAHPEVTLKTRSIHPAELAAQLHDGSVRLGFSYVAMHDAAIESVPLWSYPYCVALPSTHALAGERAIDLRRLRGERLIQYARSTSETIHDQIAAACREHNYLPADIEEAPATSRVIGSVACGDGIAVVPEHWRFIGTPGVTFVPLAQPASSRLEIYACILRDEQSPVVRDLVAIASSQKTMQSVA